MQETTVAAGLGAMHEATVAAGLSAMHEATVAAGLGDLGRARPPLVLAGDTRRPAAAIQAPVATKE